VRNNISVANAQAGIALHDYGQWGLLRGVKVGFNSAYGNETGGIVAPTKRVSDSLLVGNVGWSRSGIPTYPSHQSGLGMEENLVCDNTCFVNPENAEFSPAKNSALDRRGVGFKAGWLPEDDFFARRRTSTPKFGAVESAGRANVQKLTP